MLWNKHWDKQTKTDPFTLESLIAWLEKQPADEGYCYSDGGECLLAQYLTTCGYENIGMGSTSFGYGPPRGLNLPRHQMVVPRIFDAIAFGRGRGPYTFGAALERARAALESQR